MLGDDVDDGVLWELVAAGSRDDLRLAAAAVVAVYPDFVWFSVRFWSETLFSFLLLATLWGLTRRREPPTTHSALLGGALLGLAVGMVWGRSPAMVDWTRVRAVCIESDDWGLCGFLPDTTALVGLDREDLSPGEFPEVYWGSTLEDSTVLSRLCEVLERHPGRDGLPAVMQASSSLVRPPRYCSIFHAHSRSRVASDIM